MPYTNERGTTVNHHRHATAEMAAQFHRLFVNRRAYTLQSFKPHPDTGRHYVAIYWPSTYCSGDGCILGCLHENFN